MAYGPRSSCIAIALALRRAAIGCALGAAFSGASAAVAAPAVRADVHPYAASVAEASQRFGIPERWIWRVMHAESRGNARAVSHAGAMGLMQIMPATWAMLSARHGLGADPFDVRSNILAGAAYLRAMWDRYRDVSLMLAAYNAGPGRADAFASGRRGLPAETRLCRADRARAWRFRHCFARRRAAFGRAGLAAIDTLCRAGRQCLCRRRSRAGRVGLEQSAG